MKKKYFNLTTQEINAKCAVEEITAKFAELSRRVTCVNPKKSLANNYIT